MSGTKAGAEKAMETIRAKYGSEFFEVIGRMGGVAKNPRKGFGTHRDLARTAGAKGGQRSKRRPVKKGVV